MKNLVVVLLLLAGVAFGGKFVIEKRYESKLDEAIGMARGFAEITYDGVKIDLDGSIALNGLSVKPAGFEQSIDFGRIRAISSDRLMAVNNFSAFDSGKFPERFELSFDRMSLPIEEIEKLPSDQLWGLSGAKECRSLMTSYNYSSAGYSRIDADLRMAVDFSDIYNAVVNIDIFDQTSSTTLEWVVDASQVKSVATGRSTQLPISEINANFSIEPDAAERFNKQCADHFKVTPDVFLEKVAGSTKYSENSFGVDLGPKMREALVKFMRGGSEFSIKSRPSSQLKKMEQLKFYKTKDILRWMNLTLELDGESLPLTESVLVAEEQAEEKKKQEQQKTEAKPTYTIVSASRAEQYIGRWVRITRTNARKPLEGKLSGVSPSNRLMIDMFKHGGLTTQTVGRDEIKRIEVLNK